MKSTLAQLRQVFGLNPSATDAELIAAATRCASDCAQAAALVEERGVVSRLMVESAGALSEKMARRVIAHRASFSISQRQKNKL